ncbi:phage tail protein [Breoghania sp. L-A4]|uniref:phage tail protein n=1 Tax=Breoghania sp. L-A4 TaxID=2304600 RepID=UPI000E35D6EF|nr:phage tail protein [Breoghania sp. L-A4]AXS40667.1 phage tail protein [Breoghania sp. L-A4]
MPEKTDETWPQATFQFTAHFGADVAGTFRAVPGTLVGSSDAPEQYRHGNSPIFYPIKMPGLGRVSDFELTLSGGVFADTGAIRSWIEAIEQGSAPPGPVALAMCDDTGTPKMTWTLANARPVRVSGTDLSGADGALTVGALELAYETVTIARA